ncbi:uncharacterized protein LACBIDRAFT_312046 [Laccaria bicolor S238N-H82]|uniref:Predicted protein n=1 Tax=Laccaria bicolor (strain S238N-H82 / ATCC MYA-4686) TaxID=486041 RepID=B0CYY3_LACBS|nr:uncharacterized protein LACBIDRAFT_312046 [Laccaria bicolor S238N-H82]EDR12964.1 predicted protein [Laccaria bicolor S238N-H82]|eukprot:XP_001877228.1 predicted protein [Laccaria bicolor S238N-H82]
MGKANWTNPHWSCVHWCLECELKISFVPGLTKYGTTLLFSFVALIWHTYASKRTLKTIRNTNCPSADTA